MSVRIRTRIANAIWEEARMIGSTLSGKAADLLADAVIRELQLTVLGDGIVVGVIHE